MSLSEVLKEKQARRKLPYTSELGHLPTWAPETMAREFFTTQDCKSSKDLAQNI